MEPIGKSPVHRLSASLHDLSVAVADEGAVAAPNNGPDQYDQYSPSGASTMGRRGVSAFGNGGVKKSHAALCKSVSQVSSTDSTRTEEDDATTTASSSSGGSSGSLATALQTEIRRRAAEKSAPGTFNMLWRFTMLLCFDDIKQCLSLAFAVMVSSETLIILFVSVLLERSDIIRSYLFEIRTRC